MSSRYAKYGGLQINGNPRSHYAVGMGRGFFFSLEAFLCYVVLGYLVLGISAGTETREWEGLLLKTYIQDITIVSGLDGTYEGIRDCQILGLGLESCGSVRDLKERVMRVYGLGLKVTSGDDADCIGVSAQDVIYLEKDKILDMRFTLCRKE
jgi:hypothetical protein